MPSSFVNGVDRHGLRDPFSPQQRLLLTEDLQRAAQGAKDQSELLSEMLAVVSVWTARAARLYASDRDAELRDELVEFIKNTVITAIGELRVEVQALREENDLLAQRLSLYEATT